MRILIADDEKGLVALLSENLTNRGHKVDIAYDGEEALALINASAYDLILVDYNMPELTGLEIVKYIKKINYKTITVMITGYPEMESSLAKVIGVDFYITKPVKLESIEDIIKKQAGV